MKNNFDSSIYGIPKDVEPNWGIRWGDVISTDKDFDSDFMIRLITHKLHLMKSYFEKAQSTGKPDKKLTKIINEMDFAYNLGLRVLTFNYGEKADNILAEKGNLTWLNSDYETPEYKEWFTLNELAIAERKKDTEKLFTYIGKRINNWWL